MLRSKKVVIPIRAVSLITINLTHHWPLWVCPIRRAKLRLCPIEYPQQGFHFALYLSITTFLLKKTNKWMRLTSIGFPVYTQLISV